MATYNSSVEINTVVWITSLNERQYNVTNRVLGDLQPYLNSQEIGFIEFEPKSGADLKLFLDALTQGALEGLRPIIHIDTHGSKEGLAIEASKELVPWSEMIDQFRNLNVATENNLCVISLACFGFHQIEGISITQQTPFYILAGSQEKVYDDYIENVTVNFYKHIFDDGDLHGAYQQYLGDQLRIVQSEKLALEALVGYVRAFTMGAPMRQRVEDLLTVAVKTWPDGRPLNLPFARKLLKDGIKPTQQLVDRLAERFLIGRKVPYDINDIIKHANSMPDPYANGRRQRPSTFDHFKDILPEE